MDQIYKKLIESMPQGYAFHRVICDQHGQPIDYQFVEMNPIFEAMTGLVSKDLVGKTFKQVFPQLHDTFDWIRFYGKIALGGPSQYFEQYSVALGKHYKIYAFSPEPMTFVTFFTDVTHEVNNAHMKTMIMKSLQDIVFELDENLKFLNAFTNDESLLFMPLDEVLSSTVDKLYPQHLVDLFLPAFKKAKESELRQSVMYASILPNDDRWFRADIQYTRILSDYRYIFSVTDITEWKKIDEALRLSEKKYRLITENTSDVIWVLNLAQKRFTYISPSIVALRGLSPEEAMAESMEQSMTPDSLKMVEAMIKHGYPLFLQDPSQQTAHTAEIQQPHKDGRLLWVEVNTKYHLNSKNEVEVIGVSRNIEARKQTEMDILFLSYHDKLTGLYNRSFYEEELKRLNTDRNLPFTIILSDINGLKLTNDAFGHMAGDQLIISYAEILKRICRKDDIVARIGGDEFAILLPKTTETVANLLVDRLKEAILLTKPDKIKLSVSFGLRTKDQIEDDFTAVFKDAEDRMYHEKINNQANFKNSILQLITSSLFEKYPEEREHASTVSNHCRQMGEALSLSTKEVSDLELAGLLHDIGKIGLDELGHHYPDFDMTPEFKRHCEIGYQITRSVYEFSHIAEFIYAHHERYDGTGYPNGIKAQDIPLQARIIKIANDFSSAQQRDKLTHAQALEFIRNGGGSYYDPILVDLFLKLISSNV